MGKLIDKHGKQWREISILLEGHKKGLTKRQYALQELEVLLDHKSYTKIACFTIMRIHNSFKNAVIVLIS